MIIVTSLRDSHAQLAAHQAKRAISILSPDTPHPDFPSLAQGQHLRLTFHDVIADGGGLEGPKMRDAERLVEFISAWDQSAPLLIHCWAGISRSTAAAFTAMCLLRKSEDEMDLASELREASPSATPNRLIVSQVDQILGRDGRMVKAVAAIGRGADAFEGRPFTVRVR
ncbi:tyrosine phosphatase family protein [Aestuariivirga sp.]|uniref:tyrosine phosphatase family protein n=1 Tax=Aestuariivirga sp. TaxID=2650926 RepID=UPI0039E3D18D